MPKLNKQEKEAEKAVEESPSANFVHQLRTLRDIRDIIQQTKQAAAASDFVYTFGQEGTQQHGA